MLYIFHLPNRKRLLYTDKQKIPDNFKEHFWGFSSCEFLE